MSSASHVIARNIVVRPPDFLADFLVGLSRSVAEKFPCHFVLGQENLSHMSIYQTTYPASHEAQLKQKVRARAERQEIFSLNMGGVAPLIEDRQSPWSTFLFWDVLVNPVMSSFHRGLLNDLAGLRSQELLPEHQQLLGDMSLPPVLRESLQNHGTLFAAAAERPHFTFVRLKRVEDVDPALSLARSLLPRDLQTFKVESVWLANAGPHGVVTQVFDEYHLKR